MQALSVTASDEKIVLFNGEVNCVADLKAVVKSVAAVGTHHWLQVRNGAHLAVLSVWGIAAGEGGAADRGYAVLCELLQLLSCQSAVLPFSNSALTQLLEGELMEPTPSVVLTLDEGVEETGGRLRQCLRRRMSLSSSLSAAEKLNALKNELFVMENDADAYEDEIRRLNDVIQSLRNGCSLC